MTKWKGKTAIEHCSSPDVLLRFITRRLPEIHEEGMGNPDEEAEFTGAVARLVELCNGGALPARWRREHLKLLVVGVKPVAEEED